MFSQVIQSVTTYKSLQPFVSTTLLSRLIAKKIWETPALWEGFIRCAKAIAPASFAALLQLPKEWLEELVKKQPGMRAPLREYVVKSELILLLPSSFDRKLAHHVCLSSEGGVANAKTTAILEALEGPEDVATAAGSRSESPAVPPPASAPSVNVVVS